MPFAPEIMPMPADTARPTIPAAASTSIEPPTAVIIRPMTGAIEGTAIAIAIGVVAGLSQLEMSDWPMLMSAAPVLWGGGAAPTAVGPEEADKREIPPETREGIDIG